MTFDATELLDPVACRILAELQADGRVTMAELGRRVALSPPAVAERVRRLEEAGVITGYTACVNPQAVGYSLLAFVRLSPQGPGDLYARKVRSFLEERHEVLEAHHITGEDCYLIKIVARDGAHLEEVIAELGSMGRTTTSVALSAPVPPAPVVPAHEARAARPSGGIDDATRRSLDGTAGNRMGPAMAVGRLAKGSGSGGGDRP